MTKGLIMNVALRGRHVPFLSTLRILALLVTIPRTATAAQGAKAVAPSGPAIDFNRDIRPLLSENCFACHGPDKKQRKAKLRLDTREGALAKLRSGAIAVVPGKPDESDLIDRISSDDSDFRMPPSKTGKRLTKKQIALFTDWIKQGASWSGHWAFTPAKRPALPRVANSAWPRNPIDYFILARLEAAGLRPNAPTNRRRLLRRVTLDLTGLPPTPQEVDAFVTDRSPNAYEKVVDRLLQSPRYGEHVARFWLDAARFGDTHGLHLDNYRAIWPYRDWVIKAFNANKPFDTFVTEQLAGDLLPNATLDQQVATGFNRCHVTTSEGGSIEEEVYVRNVVDRVETTGIVFLGMTVGCARCHDHKYDPLKQKEFYQLFAFFNNIEGSPLDGNAALHPPVVRIPTANQKSALARLEVRRSALQWQIAAALGRIQYDESADARPPEQPKRGDYVWIDDDIPAGTRPFSDGSPNGKWNFVTRPAHPVYSGSKSVLRTATGLSQQGFQDAKSGLRVGKADKLFAYVYLDPTKPPREVMLQWHTSDWKHRAYWGDNLIPWGKDNSTERHRMGPLPEKGKWVRLEVDASQVGLTTGAIITGWAFTQHDGTVYWDKAGIVTQTPQGQQAFQSLASWMQTQQAVGGAALPKPLQDIIKIDKARRSASQKKQLRDYFLEHFYTKTRSTFDPLHRHLARLDKERADIEKKMPASLVFKETPQLKPAYLLKRGEYDQKGEEVHRGTPALLPPMPAKAPVNRLGLARWLLSPEHPLTARVTVNRFWQQVFGTGLVKTAEDFGAQGEPPSHPELLDWLAVQFRDDGWDMKKTMKRIVISATYRQSSRLTKDRLAKDPANRLLSRGPRFRLDAEMLRDQALAVSGLLVERLGGPSVKPPQPQGLWEAVGYVTSNTAKFTPDKGREKIHRRSLYTFWKRTAPPPQMNILDAPSRESCIVRRERTNTPLQALLLLNERQYFVAGRNLAERALRQSGATVEARLAFMFKLATARFPDAGELKVLSEAYKDHLAEYQGDEKAAKELINLGEVKPDAPYKPSELAALTMIGNLLLNLDEVLNKG
jgi:hypothetical protein